MDFESIVSLVRPLWDDLAGYQFLVTNPLFWIMLVVFFLILLRFWDIKKSFSFCLVLALVLLATTKIEHMVESAITSSGGTFEPLAVRILSLVLVSLVVLYYVFIKTD